MIETIGKALVFDCFFTESKLGKTGLTVTVDVWGPGGTEIVTAGSATELGDGLYTYTLAAALNTVAGNYRAVFKTATDTVDFQWIPALWTVGEAWAQAAGQLTYAAGGVNANVAAVKGQTVHGTGTAVNPWGP